MKRYSEYKDSGVEWIGKIPNNWTISRIKNAIAYSINGVWGDDPNENGENILCIRVADFDMKRLGVSQNNLTYRCIPVRDDDQRILKKGDLLIEKSGGGEKQPVGRVISFNLNDKAVSSNFIAKISPNRDLVDSGFLLYSFNVFYSFGINNLSIKQTTGIQNLDTTHYFNNQFCFPSLPEQVQITNFLEHKTHQIDDLIAKKQKLIELLHEERTALINQVVTKGLDPAVPLKDSGIEWLGEIPEHWVCNKLKSLGLIRYGLGQPPKSLGNGLPLIRATNIQRGEIVENDMLYINPDELPMGKNPILKKGEIIIVRSGAYTGDSAIIPSEYEGAVAGYDMVFTPVKSLPEFISFCFLSNYVLKNQLIPASSRAAQPHLNAEELGSTIIACPPHTEQVIISAYLKKKQEKFELAILKIQKEIELISEYKTSLINEAVTGKIKVSDAD